MTLLWCGLLSYYVYQSIHIDLPTNKHNIISYFEESGQDLKYLYCSILKKAKKSIFLASFGLCDPEINCILEKKRLEGIQIIDHNSLTERMNRKKVSGLYHKKILVIDEEELYIGSANCTKGSLSFHGNQIFGFSDKDLISAVLSNQSFENDHIAFYLLPSQKTKAFANLLSHIQEAKDRIIVSMYALTHRELIDELIKAFQRGVIVEVFLDKGMIKGSCKQAMLLLKEAQIPLYTREKGGLNHHKCALIDDAYILGSLNWSKAGFSKNEETLLILSNLSKELLASIETYLKNVKYYSKKLM